MSSTEKLKNYMEHLVDETLNNYLNEKDNICKCEKCRLDIKAYALNKLPPHYIVSDKGYLHWKMDEMITQFNVDVLKAVIDGVEKINNNKRH